MIICKYFFRCLLVYCCCCCFLVVLMTPKIYGYCQTSCENHNVYVSMNHMCETKMNTSDNIKKNCTHHQTTKLALFVVERKRARNRTTDGETKRGWMRRSSTEKCSEEKTSYMGKCTDFHSVKSIINSGSCSGSPISTN